MTSKSSQSQQVQQEQPVQYIRKLLNYAKQARRIEVDTERIAFFVYQATQEHYGQHQYERAKLWILYGNWTYRGNDPTLQWDDFHPTDEQVLEARKRTTSDLLVVSTHEYNRRIKQAYTDGFAAGQQQSIATFTQEQVQELKGAIESAFSK